MPHYEIAAGTPVTDATLDIIARIPTEEIPQRVDPKLIKSLSDSQFMRMATLLAQKSYDEGGCPIGGVIIDNASREIVGKGHNTMIQELNSVVHGETAATIDAGRAAKAKGDDKPVDFSKTTMFTTLTPCRVCCCQLNTRTRPQRVVIGDITNAPSSAPRLHSVEKVEILEDLKAVALYKKYAEEFPEKHYADWLGQAWYEKNKNLSPEELLQAALREVTRLDAADVNVNKSLVGLQTSSSPLRGTPAR